MTVPEWYGDADYGDVCYTCGEEPEWVDCHECNGTGRKPNCEACSLCNSEGGWYVCNCAREEKAKPMTTADGIDMSIVIRAAIWGWAETWLEHRGEGTFERFYYYRDGEVLPLDQLPPGKCLRVEFSLEDDDLPF